MAKKEKEKRLNWKVNIVKSKRISIKAVIIVFL